MIEESQKDFEFYDNNGHFPWERKKVLIVLSYKSLKILEGKNKGREIDNLLISS